VKLTLPFGVISDAYYTRLNINTAVLGGVNLEFARGIQEMKQDELKQDINAGFCFKITGKPFEKRKHCEALFFV
jgi:hypothetical protein